MLARLPAMRAVPCSVTWFTLALLCSAVPVRGQISKLVPPDSTAANYFGASAALDGEWAVLGAPATHSCGPNAGAAHVYRRGADSAWSLVQTLTPADCHEDHFFGNHVALSGDRIAITSNRPYFRSTTSNAVYIFGLGPDGVWTERQRMEQPDTVRSGPFAAALALDGPVLAVSSAGDTRDGTVHGQIYVYRQDGDGLYRLAQQLSGSRPPSEAVLGVSLALDGPVLVAGASTWTRNRPGMVYVFESGDDGRFAERQVIPDMDSFFLSIDVDGDRLAIGENRGRADRSGQVHLFERQPDGAWERVQRLRPDVPFADGSFGSLVRLSGDRVLATGYDEQLALDVNIDRIAYVFARREDTGTWHQTYVVDVGATSFAASMDLDGAVALIGQAGDGQPGQAYIVRLR